MNPLQGGPVVEGAIEAWNRPDEYQVLAQGRRIQPGHGEVGGLLHRKCGESDCASLGVFVHGSRVRGVKQEI
jgi:hypothetical protein